MRWFFCGGPERIRTAVGAFAELCLATRPQDQFEFAKIAKRNSNKNA
jgi:hypothetical protein